MHYILSIDPEGCLSRWASSASDIGTAQAYIDWAIESSILPGPGKYLVLTVPIGGGLPLGNAFTVSEGPDDLVATLGI